MTEDQSIRFSSEAEFLAHAQAMEQELVERYTEISDSMLVHNNITVAELFQRFADFGNTHAGELLRQAQDRELPQVAPWEYRWLGLNGPESCMQETHYLMTPAQALRLALRLERCAYDFYALTAKGATDPKLKRLAEDMRSSKEQHLVLIEGWLLKTSDHHTPTPEDLDPPHMPE